MIQPRFRRKFAGAESPRLRSQVRGLRARYRAARRLTRSGAGCVSWAAAPDVAGRTTGGMQPGIADPPPGIPPDFTRRPGGGPATVCSTGAPQSHAVHLVAFPDQVPGVRARKRAFLRPRAIPARSRARPALSGLHWKFVGWSRVPPWARAGRGADPGPSAICAGRVLLLRRPTLPAMCPTWARLADASRSAPVPPSGITGLRSRSAQTAPQPPGLTNHD